MSIAVSQDYIWMAHALRLAERGLYTTSPNPRVGCVIVSNHQLVGEGAHLKAGEPHAEVYALRQAGHLAAQADIYVTLEPCSHHGRTPPCVEAVIAAKPKRVIIAMQDPNPLVAGRGVDALRARGIEVVLGVMENESRALNPGFISRMTRGLPYVRCKVAASLDGRIALENGKSQWITGDAARMDVQRWRARTCAILTGKGTVLADDPAMTVRLDNTLRQPLRVIVDSQLHTSPHAKILGQTPLSAPTILAYADDLRQASAALIKAGAELVRLPGKNGQVDLHALLKLLAQRGVNEVLVEAGQGLNGALLSQRLIDELIIFYAPKLMGDKAKGMFCMPSLTDMQQVNTLDVTDVRMLGADIRVRAKPIYPAAG